MPLPNRENIHLPILKALNDNGVSMRPSDAIREVMKLYPEMTQDDIASRTPNGQNRIKLRINWARKDLVLDGYIDGSTYGVWKITATGRDYLQKNWKTWSPRYQPLPVLDRLVGTTIVASPETLNPALTYSNEGQSTSLSPLEAIESYRLQISQATEAELLQRLRNLDPSAFEKVVGQVLEKLDYGSFEDGSIVITGRSGDEGIDGVCSLDRLGLIRVKFQARSRKLEDRISGC